MTRLSDLQALIFDMDGVLYRGNTALPGAADLLVWLDRRRFPFLLLTNNSTLDASAYECKLAAMGIRVPASRILTSAAATADYMARTFPASARVFILGESGLISCIKEKGFEITDRDPQVVVVGLDRQLTYAKLSTAALAIRAGAAFLATNPDRTLPTERGDIPGAGAIVAAVAAATDVAPTMIGKPEPPMLQMAVARLGQEAARTGIVGDRVETDVLGGKRLGLPTILLLSGVTKEPPAAGVEPQPDMVFRGADDLLAAWQGEECPCAHAHPTSSHRCQGSIT